MAQIFTLPDDRDRQQAIGALAGYPFLLRKAVLTFEGFVDFKRPPRPDDWLANQYEAGQTFDQYLVYANKPEGTKNTVYIQPLDNGLSQTLVQTLARLCTVFFSGLKFQTLPIHTFQEFGLESRQGDSGAQYKCSPLLYKIQTSAPLTRRYGVIGVTSEDLYNTDDGNFVYGVANVMNKTGVFSFARYHPRFYGEERSPEEAEEIVLMRAAKVMLHEMCHMLGLLHCIYYECLMNGSNNIQETDQAPLFLCPVCLRKLHFCLEFSPVDWYQALAQFYLTLSPNFQEVGHWHQRRADAITASLPKPR